MKGYDLKGQILRLGDAYKGGFIMSIQVERGRSILTLQDKNLRMRKVFVYERGKNR